MSRKVWLTVAASVAGLIALAGLIFLWPTPLPPAFEPGELSQYQVSPVDYKLGDFHLRSRTEEGMVLTHRSGTVAFSAAQSVSFLGLGKGSAVYTDPRGNARVAEDETDRCASMTVRSTLIDQGEVRVAGALMCMDGEFPYTLTLTPRPSGVLGFSVQVDPAAREAGYNRLYLTAPSSKDEAVYGFGAQFSRTNMKGAYVPILVSEQGVGRGLQPISFFANLLYDGSAGEWHTSYASVPAYLSTAGRGLYLENGAHSIFDLRHPDRVSVKLFGLEARGGLIAGADLAAALKDYTSEIGRMPRLPDWVNEGAILGLQGGSDVVDDKLAAARRAGVPVAGLWLQDWVGQRVTSFGKQLWWSWTLDQERYPRWDALREDLAENGGGLLAYANPFLVDVSEQPGRRNLFKEAKRAGYLVKHSDGSPYLITNTSFAAGLLDLTNPDAREWITTVLVEEVAARGVKGWMADFGEALPFDVVLHDGSDPRDAHNLYPDWWAAINRDAVKRAGLEGDAFVFHRSAYLRSPGFAPAFWLGDQLVTWDAYDGLKTVVTGLMTSGLTGFQINHADIGGYTTINNPIRNYHRSKELFMRWAELSALTPVFRTHEGNLPEDNHQFDGDTETLDHFARMARLYACLAPYRSALMTEMETDGLPLVRHPVLHYPHDPAMRDMVYRQFMLGQDLMVVPVLDPGQSHVMADLPGDTAWVHLWSGESYGPGTHTVAAPLGQPPVFFREGAPDKAVMVACFSGS